MKKIGIIVLLSSSILFSCQKQESKSENRKEEPKEQVSHSAEILFISRLSSESLFSSPQDYIKVRDYMKKEEKNASVAYLDRTDFAGVKYSQQIAVDLYKWNSFTINKLSNKNDVEGGTFYFNSPTRQIDAISIGEDNFLQKSSQEVKGLISKDGHKKTVIIKIPFVLGSISDKNSVDNLSKAIEQIVKETANYLMIITVKSDLKELLKTQSLSNSSVSEIVDGKEYNIVMIANPKFWKLGDQVVKNEIATGINSYGIHISW